ncbi:hypothetical protein L332_13165 [Agrococcus pavilionensis RW1]|uniref:Uncharacterized protein n=1 Tax=Agrococcus pavilionensis RW1 TaxID=1330458 RepID=U1LS75_9MICO|nr:hypothetical protein L332_13165 [Agrococcus pavilionensis RW1]
MNGRQRRTPSDARVAVVVRVVGGCRGSSRGATVAGGMRGVSTEAASVAIP